MLGIQNLAGTGSTCPPDCRTAGKGGCMLDKILKISVIATCLIFVIWIARMSGYASGYIDGAEFALSVVKEREVE